MEVQIERPADGLYFSSPYILSRWVTVIDGMMLALGKMLECLSL